MRTVFVVVAWVVLGAAWLIMCGVDLLRRPRAQKFLTHYHAKLGPVEKRWSLPHNNGQPAITLAEFDAADGFCNARCDGIHCECWCDGECCSCGAVHTPVNANKEI